MSKTIHAKLGVVCATLALLTAGTWHVASADGLNDLIGKNLKVIGLTDDGRLVSFRALLPQRTRDLDTYPASNRLTPRSSASTSACRTAFSTEWATRAASTRSIRTRHFSRRRTPSPCRSTGRSSVSISILPLTGCASSATEARTWRTTSTPAA